MAFQIDLSPLERSSQNIAQGLSSVGGSIADILQGNKQREQQEQMQDLMQKAAGGDKQAVEQLYSINPKVAEQFEQRIAGQQQAGRVEIEKATAGVVEQMHLAKSPEEMQLIFDAAVDDDRFDIDEEDRPYFTDPNARKALITQVKGKDYAAALFGDSDVKLSAEASSFQDLIKDFTPEEQVLAKKVKAGLKGRAMSNAVLSAIKSGDIQSLAQAKAEIKQAEKFGEMTGTSRAKAIDKGFESIVKIDAGIGNIDRAIAAIDKGAGVGAVEKLWPSIKAASVELDNIRGQMALDVVGATTFGALSKGELDLAKDIALPTGLDSAELKEYLIKKKTAQEKLKSYYNEQIQFLDQGGTVAGFLRQKKGSQGQQDKDSFNSTTLGRQVSEQDISDTLQANPGLTRDQLFQQLGIQ